MSNEIHKTSDIYYAAYLKVAGVTFLGSERDGGRVIFQFDAPDPNVLRDLKTQYFNRTAKVVAMTYADECRAMKSLTHT
jgi:hypothetical protein